MPVHYILQLETATPVCGVALSADGETIAFRDVEEPNAHAARLTLSIDAVLTEAGLSFADLAAIAVGKGPGSYTGLRIGVSVAKGLCYAADLPLIGVPTLAAMAHGFAAAHPDLVGGGHWLCPMVDARRMEVFSGCYDQLLEPTVPPAALVVEAHTFDDYAFDDKIVLFGSGADKLEALFAGNVRVDVVPGFKNSATHLGRLAYQAWLAGDFADVAYFEPYYLKDFVATTPRSR